MAVVGGESGHGYRAVKKEWVASLIKECKRQRVRVSFKQWGGITPKSGGREIGGRTCDEHPRARPQARAARRA